MNFIKRFLLGISVIDIEIPENDYGVERLINILTANAVCVWGGKNIGTQMEFTVFTRDEEKVLTTAKKCGIAGRVKLRKGLSAILSKATRNMSVCTGCVAALITVYICSRHVWKITFNENYKYSSNELLSIIGEENVYPGVAKQKTDCMELEKYIRSTHPDISFVSAFIDGCVLKMTIKEGVTYEGEKKEDDLCSVISDCEGEIVSIITTQGTPQVKAGQKVKENDIIIAGEFEITDDSGTVVKKEKVSAKGDVLIRKKYTKKLSFPIEYVQREYTDKEKRSFYIKIGNNKKMMYKPLKVGEHCDIMSCKTYDEGGVFSDIIRHSFVGDYISFGVTYYYEYEPEEKRYDDFTAPGKAKTVVDNYLNELAQSNIIVNDYDYSVSFDEDRVNVEVKLDVTGAFTKRKKVRFDDNTEK